MPTVIIIHVRLNFESGSLISVSNTSFDMATTASSLLVAQHRNILLSRKSERQTRFWIRKIIHFISTMVLPFTNCLILPNPFEIQCHEFLNENHNILLFNTHCLRVCHILTPALGIGGTTQHSPYFNEESSDWSWQICRIFASIWACSLKSEE